MQRSVLDAKGPMMADTDVVLSDDEAIAVMERVKRAIEGTTIHKEAEVFGNETSLFILFKIAEMGNTTLTYLNENLVAPHGWIALARVWRADLIDVIGEYVTVTEAGKRMVAEVEAMSGGMEEENR